MGKVEFPMDHTPEEWREMARDRYRREQESFDRCDTDGFLSQWAMTVTARLYDTCAEVAEQGGTWEFRTLADVDGNPIEGAREVKTRYGWAWVVPGPNGDRWFNPSHAKDDARREAADLAKGYRFVNVRKPAVVTLSEGGLWGCYPVVLPRLRDK